MAVSLFVFVVVFGVALVVVFVVVFVVVIVIVVVIFIIVVLLLLIIMMMMIIIIKVSIDSKVVSIESAKLQISGLLLVVELRSYSNKKYSLLCLFFFKPGLRHFLGNFGAPFRSPFSPCI